MFLSKLTNLISALDRESFKRLNDYIDSPYFKIPSASVELFRYLQALYPEFPESKMKPEIISGAAKNLSTRNKAARAGSELLTAIEHFIALEDWQKQDLRLNWHRFNALQKLGLLDQYETEYKRNYEEIANDPEQDIDTFFYRHIYTELASTGFDALLNRTIRNDLSPTLQTLDEFYAIKMLRYICEAVSRKQVLGIDFNEAQMDRVIKTLEPFTNKRHLYPYLFVNVYQMLKANTYEAGKPHYEIIKGTIDTVEGISLPPSCMESMSYAVNWCLYWNAKGYQQTATEYLWWVELKMKYGLLLENGKMLPITFRNVLILAIASNQSAGWIQRFIGQYSPFLPAEHRETNVAFADGLYYYATKQYTLAIQSFLKAQAKEEVIFNAIIRRWQFMSTYEQNPNDIDLLVNQIQSFEKYIIRNKESFHQLKDVFSQFIGYAKQLLEIGNRNKRLSLRQTLANDVFFPGKPWLLEKL